MKHNIGNIYVRFGTEKKYEIILIVSKDKDKYGCLLIQESYFAKCDGYKEYYIILNTDWLDMVCKEADTDIIQ